MKIETTNTITISGKSGFPDQIKGIPKGEEMTAQIIERLGRREAILEIAGKRIHAEFKKGVPSGNVITLKLDDIKNNAVFFSLVETGGKDALVKNLAGMTVFELNQLRSTILHGIGGALAKHPAGILELNMLLLGCPRKSEKREEGPAGLLARLVKLGMDKDAVSDLSVIISGMRISSQAFKTLMMIIGFDEEKIRKWSSGKKEDISGIIDAILKDFATPGSRGDLDSVLLQLLTLLQNTGRELSGYEYGDAAFYHDDQLTPLQYIGKDTAWLFSVDFSSIGRIEVLARDAKEGYLISVFSGYGEVLEALKQSSDRLVKNLKRVNKDININFYNTRAAINKIVEIYSYYSLNSEFDILV